MSHSWLESELQRYFDIGAKPPHLLPTTQHQQKHQQQQPPLSRLSHAELHAVATAAVAEDPALAFMLRLDSVIGVRGGIVTCVATVRRNVHHYELVYLQRFKQIAEPAIRHPKSRDGQASMMMCLDPKTLKCGQRVLLKVHSRRGPTEPLQLLRESAILRASSCRDATAAFPRAYLFGCLGNSCWRVASTDEADGRQLVMHKQHFLLCQYVEDSLQRMLDANRSAGECLNAGTAIRLGREMLSRVKHLHALGWLHCDLRPACFALVGGGDDQLLLGDFASATPISSSDCLQRGAADFPDADDNYKACRFASLFADLESLVYILCSFLSPSPLPWEEATSRPSADSADDGKSIGEWKAAVWQFVEAVAASADDEATPDKDADSDAWTAWRLDRVFNCARADVGQHPGFKLAGAIAQLHREASAGIAVTVKHYDWLADSLR